MGRRTKGRKITQNENNGKEEERKKNKNNGRRKKGRKIRQNKNNGKEEERKKNKTK